MNGTADIVMADATATATATADAEPSASPAVPSASTAATSVSVEHPPLAPGTFSSILPAVEDLLELIYGVAEGEDVGNEAVAAKAKELANQLAQMKAAAMALPGGHLGNDAVSAVTQILEDEARRKRDLLRAFVNTPTPITDELASGVNTGGDQTAAPSGNVTVVPPSPAAP